MTQSTTDITKAPAAAKPTPIRRYSLGRLPLSGRPVLVAVAKAA